MSEQLPNIYSHLWSAVQDKVPLEIISVYFRGLPNQECVYLRVNKRVLLGEYFIHAGLNLPNDRALPIPNLSMWLGEDTVDVGWWIVIYTGAGQSRLMTQMKDTKEPALVMHWNCPTVIFNDPKIVPILLKIDRTMVQIGKPGSSS